MECLKSPQFNLTLELIESRCCSCLVHLQLTVEPNVIFSRWTGAATAHTSKFVVIQLKKTFERPRCIPNMRFVREEAYSSAYWLIWRLRRLRIHDMPQISYTTWCEIQTFGFVNASILLIKIGDVKLRER